MKIQNVVTTKDAFEWTGDALALSEWLADMAEKHGQEMRDTFVLADRSVKIPTLEGDMRGELGDYIICGLEGELYPCKPTIFEKSYVVVDE